MSCCKRPLVEVERHSRAVWFPVVGQGGSAGGEGEPSFATDRTVGGGSGDTGERGGAGADGAVESLTGRQVFRCAEGDSGLPGGQAHGDQGALPYSDGHDRPVPNRKSE